MRNIWEGSITCISTTGTPEARNWSMASEITSPGISTAAPTGSKARSQKSNKWGFLLGFIFREFLSTNAAKLGVPMGKNGKSSSPTKRIIHFPGKILWQSAPRPKAGKILPRKPMSASTACWILRGFIWTPSAGGTGFVTAPTMAM